MKYTEAGIYELKYKAVDSCGNETEATRTIQVVPMATVLYEDGTFIINELPRDRASNIAEHGEIVKEYAPLDENNDYVYTATRTTPWASEELLIRSVKFGSPVTPTSLAFWFDYCENMTDLDWTNFDGSEVTTMRSFLAHTALTSVTFPPMPKLTTIRYILNECESVRIADFSQVGSDIMTDMMNSFAGSHALAIVDLSGLSGTIQEAQGAFAAVWNVPTAIMALTTIYVNPDLDFSSATNSANMFRRCNNLVGGAGTVWNANYINNAYARIDNPPTEPGYFTLKQ